MGQVLMDLFLRYVGLLRNVEGCHGTVLEQLDDLLAKGSHGCGQDAFPPTFSRTTSISPGMQAATSLALV